MSKAKVTKTGSNIVKSNVKGMAAPKNLAELRAGFDGFRDVAAKLPEGSIKTQLLTKVEEMYLGAANWFTGIHTLTSNA